MGLFDDLYDKAREGIQAIDVGDIITSQINQFFQGQQQQSTPLVVQGPYPTGNLTQAQLAAGMVPQTQPIASPQASPASIARAAGESAVSTLTSMGPMLPIILIAGVGAFFFFERR